MQRECADNPEREVSLQHVRSHIKVPGNEIADWLADEGRKCGDMKTQMDTKRAETWLRHWMMKHTTQKSTHADTDINTNTIGDPEGEG